MNSAKAANTWKTSRPPGVVVSSCSCRDRNLTLWRRQVGHDRDQVLQGATEPGQLGDHKGVAFEEVFESLGQA
jgi:hypothetical protein